MQTDGETEKVDVACAQLKACRADLEEALRRAAAAERRAEQWERRTDGLREQRGSITASTLALLARALSKKGTENQDQFYLKTAGQQKITIYALADGTLVFSPLTGESKQRICIISMPKSGTYLVGALLKKFGLVDSGVHVDRLGLSDYRDKSIEEMRSDYLKFSAPIPIEISSGLTGPGQFIVGHLDHSPQCLAATADFRRIVLIRNPRDALVSFMHFWEIPGRGETAPKAWLTRPDGPDRFLAFLDQWGEILVVFMRGILGWLGESDVVVVRFEDLMGDFGQTVQHNALERILNHAGVPVPTDIVALFMRDVVGKPTKTWSGARSETRLYWDDRVETQFDLLGGNTLQNALGYTGGGSPSTVTATE